MPSTADAGWKAAAPLPEPRWFHQAGTGSDGRIYAFAGRIRGRECSHGHGVGEHSLVVYDPSRGAWSRGPEAPEFRVINRFTMVESTPEKKNQLVPVEGSISFRLPFEGPNGGADRAGRIFWFGRIGPVFFDPALGAWGQPPPPVRIQKTKALEGPHPLYQRGGAATAAGPDGRLYLLGGIGRRIGAPDNAPHELLRSVEIYDPATNTWSEAAPMLRGRQLLSASFGQDGKLYVFGGYAHVGFILRWEEDAESDESFEERSREMSRAGNQALDAVEAYDPETDTWERRAPMPLGVDSSGAALAPDGRIYVVGGTPSFSDQGAVARVQVYDPSADAWSEGPSLETARHSHAVVATPDGRIWAIGGFNARQVFHPRQIVGGVATTKGGPLDSVEFLDTGAGP